MSYNYETLKTYEGQDKNIRTNLNRVQWPRQYYYSLDKDKIKYSLKYKNAFKFSFITILK